MRFVESAAYRNRRNFPLRFWLTGLTILPLVGLLIFAFGLLPQGFAAPITLEYSPVFGSKQTQAGPSYQRNAIRAIRRGERQSALDAIKQGIKNDPEASPAEVQLAGILLQEGQAAQARLALEEAVVMYPDDPEPNLAFGDLAWKQRRLTDAYLQYNRARQLADAMPDFPRKVRMQVWALSGLGAVAETRGQSDNALALFNQVLEKEPNHPQAHYRLGNIEFNLEHEREAFQHFQAASNAVENGPSAALAMAGLYLRSGDADKAERWHKKAIEDSPDNPDPRIALAQFLLNVRNDYQAARTEIAEAVKAVPDNRRLQLLSALAAWRGGDLKLAERKLEQLAIDAPDNPDVNAYLASVLAERGGDDRVRRARELATINAETNKKSVTAVSTYGWVVLHDGATELATRQLAAATQVAPSNRDIRYYYARALFRGGNVNEAKQQLRTALNGSGMFIHLEQARKWGRELGLTSQNG